MVHCKHLDCMYRSWHGHVDVCDYIGMEGRRRPCPAGECKGVYVPSKGASSNVWVAKNEDKLWAAYEDGWSDRRIAVTYHINKSVVKAWRDLNHLPDQLGRLGAWE